MSNPDTPLRIFVGYDERETVAYHVLCHSILSQTRMPVTIAPLMSRTLANVYSRKRSPTQATDFSFTRFLVPYLSGYEGVSVFMDCDMMLRADISELGEYLLDDRNSAAFCCHHDYTPTETVKFLGNEQKAYPRKNWSSFVVFRNNRCRNLTPDYVNTASPADLHRFAWLSDDPGVLPLEWNHLVSAYAPNAYAKNVHWTVSGPWFAGSEDVEFADEWRAMRDSMLRAG